jgi:hypothetical protein
LQLVNVVSGFFFYLSIVTQCLSSSIPCTHTNTNPGSISTSLSLRLLTHDWQYSPTYRPTEHGSCDYPETASPGSSSSAHHHATTIYPHPVYQQYGIQQSAVPGVMPAYKRIAMGDISKGGIPVYQTNQLMSPLQHTSLMQLQQPQSYIPMSFTGHPPSVPRF